MNEAKDFAARITAAWHRHIDAILETADLLIRAKDDYLAHGQFTAMINNSLPFGPDVAQRLMTIGRHTALRKAAQDRLLPGRWTTLFELTRLSDDELNEALADGRITPHTTRAEAHAIGQQIPDTGLEEEGDEEPAEAEGAAGQEMPDTDLEDFGEEGDEEPAEAEAAEPAEDDQPAEDDIEGPFTPHFEELLKAAAAAAAAERSTATQSVPLYTANPTEQRLLAAELAMRDVCTIVRVRADEASSRSLDDCEAAHKRLGKWIEWFRNGDGSFFAG